MGLVVCCPVFPKGQESERHLPEQATQEEGTIKTCSLWQMGRGVCPLAHKNTMGNLRIALG